MATCVIWAALCVGPTSIASAQLKKTPMNLGVFEEAAPVDASGAVGPRHLVALTNHGRLIHDHKGAEIDAKSLAGFWAEIFPDDPPRWPGDPRIVWNPHRSRFVATSIEMATSLGQPKSELLIAVSRTDDPTGGWIGRRYAVPIDLWLDYANLGFNKRWVAVQVDLRSRENPHNSTANEQVASRIYVFEAVDLESPGPAAMTVLDRKADPNDWIGYEIPALTYNRTQDELYFVQSFEADDGDSQSWIAIYRLAEEYGRITFTRVDTLSSNMLWTSQPLSSRLLPQADFYPFLESDGDYIQWAVQHGSDLWAAHSVFLPPRIGARSSIQWWHLDVKGPTVTQVGRVDDPKPGNDPTGRQYSHPSMAVNAKGDAVIAFGQYATTIYPAAAYAYRRSTDPKDGSTRGPFDLVDGNGSYSPGDRWSDYTSTVIDPVDDSVFWTLQVVAEEPARDKSGEITGYQYGLYWVKLELPP